MTSLPSAASCARRARAAIRPRAAAAPRSPRRGSGCAGPWRAPWRSRRAAARQASAAAPPGRAPQAESRSGRTAPASRRRSARRVDGAERVRGSRRNQMFCSTVRSGISDSSWNTAAMPRACARLGLAGPKRRASTQDRAGVAAGPRRTRIWMKVLLPAPFSPSSACTSPARGAESRARSAPRCRRSAWPRPDGLIRSMSRSQKVTAPLRLDDKPPGRRWDGTPTYEPAASAAVISTQSGVIGSVRPGAPVGEGVLADFDLLHRGAGIELRLRSGRW